MSISRHGTAFTAVSPGKLQGLSQIAVFLDLEASSDGDGSLEKIAGYFISQEEKNFFVGQWKNGMEFHVRTERSPRGMIFGEDGILPRNKRTACLAIYDGQRLHLYADRRLIRRENRGSLSFTNWSKDYPLGVGADGNGRSQWKGTIYEVAIFDRALSPSEVQGFKGSRVQGSKGEKGQPGSKVHGLKGLKGEKEKEDNRPLIHYLFIQEYTYETEFRGRKAIGVRDLGKGEPADLVIPERFEPYRRIYLGSEGDWFKRWADWEDIIVNIVGFVPFGALLFVQFIKRRAPVQGFRGPGVQGEERVQGFKGPGVQGEDKKIEQQAASHKQQGENSEIAAHPSDARNDREGKENPPVSPFIKGGGKLEIAASAEWPPRNDKEGKGGGKYEIATGPRPLAMTQRDMMLALGLAVVVGFGVSLAIEWLQAYLPSRDSSLRDLVTNVLGTFIGAVIAAWYSRKGFGLPASGFGINE